MWRRVLSPFNTFMNLSFRSAALSREEPAFSRPLQSSPNLTTYPPEPF
jgi:hypothetical protein